MSAIRDPLDLDMVHDRDSFIRFVHALTEDRKQAESLERADPVKWQWCGARGWQNSAISTFLECAVAGAEAQRDWGNGLGPTWRDLAVFLYLGKIYE